MKILITGFDPFDNAPINPAYETVKLLPDVIAGAEIIKLEIPTVFGEGADKMEQAICEEKPDAVLCIGQAGGRSQLTPEFVGINYMDARIPDNSGRQPKGMKIHEDGPDAYFTKLPVRAMTEAMKAHGIPAAVSYTAGTFVCNDVLYRLLYMIDKKYPCIRGGFMHVPFDVTQVVNMPAGTPALPISLISEGIGYAVEAIIANETDIAVHSGTTH